jgi:hypothetical protein
MCAIFSCKKPKDPDPVVVPPVVCNTPNSTLVKNDTTLNIATDTAYATLNNTFYTEHTIATAHGCSVEFEGGVFPPEGTYIITPVFNEVVPGSHKVYIQYYEAGNSFIGQSGNVSITGSGTSSIIEFCKIKFKDSFGSEKTLSLKTDSE